MEQFDRLVAQQQQIDLHQDDATIGKGFSSSNDNSFLKYIAMIYDQCLITWQLRFNQFIVRVDALQSTENLTLLL
jgi:hypothetical protein